MGYDFWGRDSELTKQVKAERLQRASDNSISQPLNENCIQDGYMQPVVTDNQAAYDGDVTISNPGRLCQPASSVAVSPPLNQEMVWHTAESAWQPSHNSYLHESFYSYTSAPSLSLSNIYLSNLPPTVSKPFHTSTHSYRQCPDFGPILNGEVEPDTPHSSNTCMWHDGDKLCGRTMEGGVTQHMGTFHFMSQKSHYGKITCEWKGCRRSEPYRRDTIVRHIREVHLGNRRSPQKHNPC